MALAMSACATTSDPTIFLLARSMAPGLVAAADIMEFDRKGEAVDPRGRTSHLERFIHSEIYQDAASRSRRSSTATRRR